MAPFKLKFRMGSSRSTSQEHDPDPQVNEALLNHHATAIGASNSTIDSADCNSLGSLSTTNERKSLLPNKSNNLRLGYINHNITQCINEATTTVDTVPTTPPPSYEHVLEENTRLANSFDLAQQRQLTSDSNSQQSRNSSRQSINLNSMEQLSLNEVPCTDPDCQQNVNYVNKEKLRLQQQQQQQQQQQRDTDDCRNCDNDIAADDNDYSHKESIDSTELLISMNMTDIPHRTEHHDEHDHQQQQLQQQQQECQLEQCYDENCTGAYSVDENDGSSNHDSHYHENAHNHGTATDYGNGRTDSDSEDCCETQHMLSNQHQHEQQQQQQSQYEQRIQHERAITPEIISNKSSKEIYKDLAKQWGITCKMSDGCRCMECQSHYFDCEFDDNEHQKTDGGLGAGTPMFISEVMHGTACTIL